MSPELASQSRPRDAATPSTMQLEPVAVDFDGQLKSLATISYGDSAHAPATIVINGKSLSVANIASFRSQKS
jgi:hypothetical protein